MKADTSADNCAQARSALGNHNDNSGKNATISNTHNAASQNGQMVRMLCAIVIWPIEVPINSTERSAG